MDYFSVIKRGSALALITVLLISFSDQQSIFASLALVNSGLDFPYTQAKLVHCRETANEPCLKTYQRVKAAKKSLFLGSREQALRMTLDTISTECAKEQTNLQENLACSGAITALYFFPTQQDDMSIRSFLENTSFVSLQCVASNGSMWLLNRENKSAWRDWITKSSLSTEAQTTFLSFLGMQSDENLTINHLDDSAPNK
jgi:hypothetical protein